jgi:hypothetical protein
MHSALFFSLILIGTRLGSAEKTLISENPIFLKILIIIFSVKSLSLYFKINFIIDTSSNKQFTKLKSDRMQLNLLTPINFDASLKLEPNS